MSCKCNEHWSLAVERLSAAKMTFKTLPRLSATTLLDLDLGPSCITDRPRPVRQISYKLKLFFWTDGRKQALLARLSGEVKLTGLTIFLDDEKCVDKFSHFDTMQKYTVSIT